jgi:glycosyltransferase involved in cell wall biosynthesis
LKSIINQTFEDWELVAIDDFSTDNSHSLLTQFSQKDQRIKVFRNVGSGIVNGLNLGISLAKSDFIARMDADDIMFPNRLSEQMQLMYSNKDLGLVSSLVKHLPSDNQDARGYESYVKWTNEIKSNFEISNSRFIESPFAHPSVIFRKELIHRYGGYRSGNFPEDYELWLRFLKNNVKMQKVDKVLLEWRDRKNRLSRTDSRYSLRAFQRIKAEYFQHWIKENITLPLPIHAWGAGKFARRQIKYLQEFGINIECSYEVDFKKIKISKDHYKINHYKDIPPPGACFIVVLVGQQKIRQKINRFLKKRGYEIIKDYIFLA